MDQFCVICTESLESKSVCLECGHIFHRSCLIKWYNKKYMNGPINCPVCRKEFDIFKIINKEKIKQFKELNNLSYEELFKLVTNLNSCSLKNSFSEEEKEEMEVFCPLFHKYINTENEQEFVDLLNILIERKYQKNKYKHEAFQNNERQTDFMTYSGIYFDPISSLLSDYTDVLNFNFFPRRNAITEEDIPPALRSSARVSDPINSITQSREIFNRLRNFLQNDLGIEVPLNTPRGNLENSQNHPDTNDQI